MKKTLKFTTVVLSLLCALCLAIGITSSVKAEDNYGSYDELFGIIRLDNFEMYDGGYVRTESPTGIRFETGISNHDKAKFDETAQFGTLVSMRSIIGDSELSFESERYIDIKIENWLSETPSMFGDDYQGYYSTVVGGTSDNFTDFDPALYNEIFVARSYVKYQDQIFYTPNSVERTIAGLAETAIWEGNQNEYLQSIVNAAEKIELTYNTNGGNAIESLQVVKGSIIEERHIPAQPVKEGSVFLGWFKDSACTEKFEFSGILKESVTLYAGWETSMAQYSPSVLVKDGTDSSYTYSSKAMTGSDAKPNTYSYAHTEKAQMTDDMTVSVNLQDDLYAQGNYLVIDFYVSERTADDMSNLHNSRLIENVNSPLNTFTYYDENNNVIPDRIVTPGKWYKAVLKILSPASDRTFKIGNNSKLEIYIANVKIYLPELFESEISGGVEASDVPATSYYLINDGVSDYKIVLPTTPAGYEEYASTELQKYFEKATGVTLPIVKENQLSVSFSESSKYIVIGDTQIAKDKGVTADLNTYGSRGFRIKQQGSNVIMLGGESMGTLCAVYEFLHHQFGFEAYAINYTKINTGVTTQNLLAFDISDIPDAEFTHGYYYERYREGALTMRYNFYDEIFISATGQPWHNTFEYVSPDTYKDSHPDWFTDDGKQLHYSAHGNASELQAMQDLVYNKMTAAIDRDFANGNYYKYIGFIHEDNNYFASDSSVDEFKATYGDAYPAAMVIQFINPIAERLEQYMIDNHDGREMNIVLGAYLKLKDAPVTNVGTTENPVYQPIDSSVVLNENVSVMIAAIEADYSREFAWHNSLSRNVAKWNAITTKDEPLFWFYDFYSMYSMIYFDNTYNLKNVLGVAGTSAFVFNETAQPHMINPFGELKTYLTSKLTWDNGADLNELVDDFFDDYYGVASESMWKMYDRLLSYMAPMLSTGSPYLQVMNGAGSYYQIEYWDKEILDELLHYVDMAYADIAPIQAQNPELYSSLSDRIKRESLMARYLLIEHYAVSTFSSSYEFEQAKEAFVQDCADLGITQFDIYNTSISSLMNGIAYD